MRQLVASFLILSIALPHLAGAQNTMFLRRSPVAYLSDEDRAILRATIREVLESPDGTVRDWNNPDTGSRGRVKVLDTQEDAKLGATCRTVRARNDARGRQSDGIYRLCLAKDGTWKFASTQASTQQGDNAPTSD